MGSCSATFATFAEFEANLIQVAFCDSIAIARSPGKLPKLSDKQRKEWRRMQDPGEHSNSDFAE